MKAAATAHVVAAFSGHSMIEKILKIWSAVEMALIGALTMCSLACFLGGAIVRAVWPAHAVDWAEEISIYLIIWATVISGSVLAAEGRHINTDVFVMGMPEIMRRVLPVLMILLTLGFCVVMMVYGWRAFEFALLLDERSASTLRVPQAYAVFLALPVGMALIIGRILLLMLLRRGIVQTSEAGKTTKAES
tara:strand:+ start:18028 stop:18600 length:573 start_codon:yes stop_codon:yes gene_type:complete